MTRQRSPLAGGTDYAGYSLDDILAHLCKWKENTDKAIALLREHLASVVSNKDRLDHPGALESYIRAYIDLFERFSCDFQRLVDELPHGVRKRHVTLVRQIYDRSDREDKNCVYFKNKYIETSLRDESLRYCLLDQIYSDTRGMIIDFTDLSNVAHRLETYVEDPASPSENKSLGGLDVKPNWFGIGIDLNPLLNRLAKKFRRKKAEQSNAG